MQFSKLVFGVLSVCALSLIFYRVPQQTAHAQAQSVPAPQTASQAAARAQSAYGQLPLGFEANQGQSAAPVKFLARGAGYRFFLTDAEAVLRLPEATLRMQLRGANPQAHPQATAPLPGLSNYFTGRDARTWRTGVQSYARVSYAEVYPGIELVWHGRQRQLEHDFLLAPGADARRIVWQLAGARAVRHDKNGALLVELAGGDTVRWRQPQAWQTVNGERRTVACRYVLPRTNEVAFQLGVYDPSLPLVIDPVLEYSTYLGGNGIDSALGVAVDSTGSAYLTGVTSSTDFPGASAIQATKGAQQEAFVLKLNPAGNAVVYATWLGGAGNDSANKIAVDGNGNAVIIGTTASNDFPLKDALQTTRKGGNDVFVTKLNAAGSMLLFSTYLGGSTSDTGTALALDASANVYLTGFTDSADFPLQNPLQNTRQGSLMHTSVNAGGAWNALGTGLNAQQITDLAIDPKTPATLYAGTERGLFKSTNSGAAWTQVANTPFTSVTQIVIDPVTPTTLYVISSFAPYKSTDGGTNWHPVPSPEFLRTLVIDPLTPATLYAASLSGSVLKSTDGGATWTPQTIPPPFGGGGGVETYNLAVDPQTPQNVYAVGNRGVFKTTNGGMNWMVLTNGLPGNIQVSLPGRIAISPSNPAVVFIYRAALGTYRTNNGGGSWQGFTISTSPQFTPSTFVFDPTNANVVYAGSNLGVFKSTDGGATWNAVNAGLNGLNVRALAIPPNAPATLYAGSFVTTDAFVSKLSANGSTLLYSTYLGGGNIETATDIAVDAAGNAYVCGTTQSSNLLSGFAGINGFQTTLKGLTDAYVAKLNPAGTALVWTSYLGGDETETASSLALNAAGNVFITGQTTSINLPVVNAAQPTNRSAATVPIEAFVTRFAVDGKTLDYSTYLGGADFDSASALAVDAAGNAYVAGQTASRDFPLASAVQTTLNGMEQGFGADAFVTKLSADGKTFLYSTFLGGQNNEAANEIAVDGAGNAYVTGFTASQNFPTTPNPLRAALAQQDAFITKLALNADLAVSLNDLPDPVMLNNPLTLTATVTNNGPDLATGVQLSVTLPTGVTLVSATPSQGNCTTGAPLTCALGNLAGRASATVTLTLTPTAVATITTRVSVTSASPDLTTANNSATQETRIVATPSIYGRVTLGQAGLPGVNLALTGAQRPAVQTNAEGFYQFAELSSGGNYTVTPSRAGYVFNPASRSFNNLTSDQRGDFAAVACQFTLAPRTQSFPAIGGTGTLTLTATDPQCPWMARSNVPWITLTSASNGQGSTTARFTVAPTVAARQGSLTIAGQRFTIFQEFNACATVNLGESGLVYSQLPGGTYEQQLTLLRDFNGDGRGDLVTVNVAVAHTLQFFPGLADGKFGNPVPVLSLTTGGALFIGISTGDFNNDGKLDLVAVSGGPRGRGIWVINGDGAGGFAQPRNFPLASPDLLPTSVAAGDLNGDGRADLAIGLGAAPYGTVLLNDGMGGFGAARNLPSAGNFASNQIELSDLDGDGKLDLFRRDGPGFNLFKGDGAGNFTALPNFILPFTGGLTWGDFNGDRKLDFVFTTQEIPSGQPILQVQLNDGTGRFTTAIKTPINFTASPGLTLLTAADFNNDGRTDLALSAPLTNNSQQQALWFFSGSGTGAFASPVLYLANENARVMVISDYNRDGRPDLFQITSNGALNVLTATATGFNAPRGFSYGMGGGPQNLAAGDVNGDGVNDLVISAGLPVWLPGNGRGEYGAPVPITNEPNNGIAGSLLRDFNRDGRLDVAVLYHNAQIITIYLNNGRGEFSLRATLNTGASPTRLDAADFNQDGAPDLVARGPAGGLSLYLNNGQGSFTPNATGLGGAQAGDVFAVGDFNGDGLPDLALPDPATQSGQGTPRFLILPGNGQGGFGATQFVAAESSISFLLASDLNLDGRDDLIYPLYASPYTLNIALSNASGGYDEPTKYPVASAFPFNLQVTDLNGDGKADLLAINESAPGLSLWLGKGDGTFNASVTLPTPATPSRFLTTDVDEDGSPDVVLALVNAPAISVLTNRTSCLPAGAAVTVSAASYARYRNAPNAISALFGANLAAATQSATTLPLPTTLGTTSLRVRDSAGLESLAPLFFVSASQINYLTPTGLASGVATLTVLNGSNVVATGTTLIAPTAPGLFTANASGQGLAAAVVLRVRADGSQVYEPVVRTGPTGLVGVPIDVSNPAEQVFLLLYGTGIRQRSALSAVTARIGGLSAEVVYAGSQGGLVGLDQLNIRLPQTLAGRGEVELQLLVDGRAANPVNLVIK